MADVAPAPPPRRQLDVWVPGRLWTVNDERAEHWTRHRAATREWRETAAWAVIAAKVPRLARVRVAAFPFQRAGGRLADVGAHLPPVKAAVDGLVDAGILPDDGPDVVVALMFYPPQRAADRGEGLRLVLIEEIRTEG